jgi:hypothetical protein
LVQALADLRKPVIYSIREALRPRWISGSLIKTVSGALILNFRGTITIDGTSTLVEPTARATPFPETA